MLPLLRTPLQMMLTGAGAAGGGAAPFVGALDAWGGGKGAWSLHRRLLSSYTGVLWRGRRGGDDEEMDMTPLPDGTIDTAALADWSVDGGGNGWVYAVTIYDQSGNGNDLEQSSAGMQMSVVEDGVVNVTGSEAYPCARSEIGNTCLYYTQTFSPNYTGPYAWLFTNQDVGDSYDTWNSISLSRDTEANWDSSERAVILSMSAGAFDGVRAGLHSANFPSSTGLKLMVCSFNGSGWRASDGSTGADDTTTPEMQGSFNANRFLLAAYGLSSPYCGSSCKFVEAVVYLSDMNADEAGITNALGLIP